MRANLRHLRALLVGGTLSYLVVWGITYGIGAPAIRSFVVEKMQVPTGFSEVSSLAELNGHGNSYYCSAWAPAPLLVRLEFGSSCGPLCGRGRTEYFLWLPGIKHKFLVTAEWIS
jgi:hypothetical protein